MRGTIAAPRGLPTGFVFRVLILRPGADGALTREDREHRPRVAADQPRPGDGHHDRPAAVRRAHVRAEGGRGRLRHQRRLRPATRTRAGCPSRCSRARRTRATGCTRSRRATGSLSNEDVITADDGGRHRGAAAGDGGNRQRRATVLPRGRAALTGADDVAVPLGHARADRARLGPRGAVREGVDAGPQEPGQARRQLPGRRRVRGPARPVAQEQAVRGVASSSRRGRPSVSASSSTAPRAGRSSGRAASSPSR